MEMQFGNNYPLVLEIVKRSRLRSFDREPSGYTKLMGNITSAELFPHEKGVVLVLAEGSENVTINAKIQNLRAIPIEDLLGSSGRNNSWLIGNGKNRTHATASAYLIPHRLEKHPHDKLWDEVDALLDYARVYARGGPENAAFQHE